jgi:hypothetical protein
MLRLFETREQKEDKANREAAELELMIRGANAHLDSALLDVTCKKAIKAWGPLRVCQQEIFSGERERGVGGYRYRAGT